MWPSLGRILIAELLLSDLLSRLQSVLGDTYQIERELGGGGMSRVFLAQETRLGRYVVIKVLPRFSGSSS